MIAQHRQNNNQSTNQDDLASPKAKGERLKRIRRLANLSREEFCEEGEVNITTLISWEVGRFGGLSEKGANRVIARVAKEGVFCTLEWLLYEVGTGPEVRADFKKLQIIPDEIDIKNSSLSEQNSIIEELMLFRKLNKHAIDFVIVDDAMLPHYRMGDCVAGVKRFGEKIKSLVGWDCIAQLSDGRIVMRNLQPGPKEGSYNLVPTNLQTKVKDAILYDISVLVVAPILWHRRQEPVLE